MSTATAEWILAAMQRYEDPLKTYSYSIVRDIELVRDAVQDTFLRLCKQEQETIEDHLAQWLFTVCRNCSLKILQKKSRFCEWKEEHDNHETLVEYNLIPSSQMDREEVLAQVRERVKKLSPNQRKVIELRYWGGLSYIEISEATGLSIGNVAFILSKATAKLRQKIKPN